MTHHTPGPWVAEIKKDYPAISYTAVFSQEKEVARCFGRDQETNVRLIAQAPAMLEVLQDLEKVGMSVRAESVIWKDIRAVLAKVEGG